MTRLLLAGQAWDDITNAFVGGRIVRLEEDGSWTEVFSSTTIGCHSLREFTVDGLPFLFFIDSPGSTEIPERGTLYRSGDEGDTWLDVSPGPTGANTEYVMSYAMGTNGRLWAITDERQDPATVVGAGPSRIYYSDDLGSSWTLSYTIPESFIGRGYPAYNITVNPTDSDIVIVEGVETVGLEIRLWRTTDGGLSWSAAFGPTFPIVVENVGRGFAKQIDYASDGTLVYITRARAANTTLYILRSSDDGDSWSTWHSESRPFSVNDGNFFLEGCTSDLWFLSEQRVWHATDFSDTPPTEIADDETSPFVTSQSFVGLDCISGLLTLGVFESVPDVACCDPAGIYQRPINLNTGWVEHPGWAAMDGDLGYRVYPWPWGVIGATEFLDRYELPCEDAAAAGDFNPQCIPILNWEISVDGQHSYFSRARAQGMGISNAGQDSAALLPNENVWAPTGTKFGDEGGTYNIRRDLIVNDYGINQAAELDNLAGAYLPSPDKTFKGITTIKFQVGGIPRAGSQAPIANKIIQAGDQIRFCPGSQLVCNIAEGAWIVDEVSYEFPKGITTILASQRPAAHARPMVSGNIRNLGESLAAVGGVYESPWFSTSDASFLADPTREGSDSLYDTFAFEHFMGVPPRTITMVAAKNKIFDWYDEDLVIAAQPLYVPRQFIDLSQVQGVGYNVVEWGKNKIVFHFLRYLFYDDIDGVWVRPQDRFIKVWLLP
ncbi:hypothetical protein LCGC14_0824240 [marine sediment metagenome]|uniref:Sialidase domain-containing protein n=1 Tax=marine sediment metagenome TaxID=412755 RepID=A0A0F9PHV7_9ZZZZ